MKNKTVAAALIAGLLASGCASYEDTDPDNGGVYGARQEGNLDAAPQRDVNQPYTPVLGDTTGDGAPRDRRTGGAITGDDVTPAERANQNQRTNSNTGGGGTGGGGGPTPP
jgi:hypothetical protein